jgi:hypothetical protein
MTMQIPMGESLSWQMVLNSGKSRGQVDLALAIGPNQHVGQARVKPGKASCQDPTRVLAFSQKISWLRKAPLGNP